MTYSRIFMSLLATALCVASATNAASSEIPTATTPPARVGFHEAHYDAAGKLIPWTTWDDAIKREMEFYLRCPIGKNGYPVFVYTTFMNDNYTPYKTDIIPATQDGMGILSYLKYWEYTGKKDKRLIDWATKMGDYLVVESLTPDKGVYPKFIRSTGVHTQFPLQQSSQGDAKFGPNVIEPDKGGIAGYALLKLYDVTGKRAYYNQALHDANLLAKNMRTGDATHSPWPFRQDSVTGQYWGERSGDMVFNLRLFDELIARSHKKFKKPRNALWTWIKTYQIPAPEERAANLWIDFFEDQTSPDNRTSWAPLEMARYLIEKKDKLDPDWKNLAGTCIVFAIKYFGIEQPGGVLAVGEQDVDQRGWGGACSKLGGVAAMYYAAGGGEKYKDIAYRNLTWMMYHIDDDGCPAHQTGDAKQRRGGWQEDCHTDVIHNFMDAIKAVPEWGSASKSAAAK